MNGTWQAMMVQFRNAFGWEFIAYVCDLEQGSQDVVRCGDLDSLAVGQKRSLEELVRQLEPIRRQSAIEGVPPTLMNRGAAAPDVDGETFFNSLRLRAGGALPSPTAGNSAAIALQEVGIDVYPILLMEVSKASRDSMGIPMTLGVLLLDHVEARSFIDALLADEGLAALFPDKDGDVFGIQSYVWASTGRGGSVQLSLLPGLVLQAAFVASRIAGGGPQGFIDEIARMLERLRGALAGEQVHMPAYLGFRNVNAGSEPFVTSAGVIVPYLGQGDGIVGSNVLPPTDSEGTRHGFVLETEVPFRLEVSTDGDEVGPPPAMWTEALDVLDDVSDLVSLAWSLAVSRTPSVSCTRSWQVVPDPLSPGPLHQPYSSSRPFSDPLIAGQDDREAAERWIRDLGRVAPDHLDIARRRLLSALTSRLDPADAFIDAVICWENLVGGTGPEITFRVSVVMAWLLMETEEERLTLQKRIAKLYGLRSKVVHGSLHLDAARARSLRGEAVDLAVSSLRRFLQDFPDLAGEKDRGSKLLARLS